MQIVIDIPKRIYDFLQTHDTGVRVDRAIANGIPISSDCINKQAVIEVLEKNQKWIPVTERPPEEGKTVIVSGKHNVYPEARFTKKYGMDAITGAL